MAKCPICNSRKGQRPCLIATGPVCSFCCGNTRQPDSCSECRFYQKPKRSYNDVPAFAVTEMDGDFELASYSNAIEGALCAFDVKNKNGLQDSDAISIIEALIDLHYFGDNKTKDESDSQLIVNGVDFVERAIKTDLHNVDNEEIVKILGVVRFVARRRAKSAITGREYMNVIHRYVGLRIGPGMQALRI